MNIIPSFATGEDCISRPGLPRRTIRPCGNILLGLVLISLLGGMLVVEVRSAQTGGKKDERESQRPTKDVDPSGLFRAGLKWVPDESDMLFSVRLSTFAGTDSFQKLCAEFPALDKLVKDLQKSDVPLDPDDIVMLVGGGKVNVKDQFAGVIFTRAEWTAEKLLAKQGNPVVEKITAGPYIFHKLDINRGFCLVDGKTIVTGKPDLVLPILKRNAEATLSVHMKTALHDINPASSSCWIVDLAALPQNQPLVPGFKLPPPQYLALDIGLTAKVHFRATTGFADNTAADEARKAIEGFLALAKLQAQVPPEVVKLLGDLKLSSSGNRIVSQVDVDVPTLIQLVKLSQKNMNRGN